MENIIYLDDRCVENFAWVTDIPNRTHRMFKLVFDNGYENIFFTDVESGAWVEEDLGFTGLALQVGTQLNSFVKKPVHIPKILTWHKQWIDGELLSFGFFNFMKNEYKMYEIYHDNKKYLYTLVEMENEEWQILGNSTLPIKHIDVVFLERLIQILPLYWANAR